jgi:alkanesulfonate monooxygenase SsuD/methylene tetrahydromethanopterin reductase-like flavin-dependent oxidoreductase (luciferase family)
MLECYTLLAALASTPRDVRLSSLVTGNTYRNPTLLAKIVTTLDVVSKGRAQLGIGAGWFEAGARVARLRVRHLHRPVREARRGPPDHHRHAPRRAPHLDGRGMPSATPSIRLRRWAGSRS